MQGEVMVQHLRCLLRVPTVRALKLGPCDPYGMEAVLYTLHRSRLEVTDTLSVDASEAYWDQDVASGALVLLWRSRHRLQEVTLTLFREKSCLCSDRGGGDSLLHVLWAMPALRRLNLSLSRLTAGFGRRVDCVPGLEFPPLQQLQELSVSQRGLVFAEANIACVVALLRAAAPSLRSLSLASPLPDPSASAELEAAVGLCVGLREAVIDFWLPPPSALAAWTSVESLRLYNVELYREEHLTELDRFLQCCAQVGSLRRLSGSLFGDLFDFPRTMERCRQLVGDFRQARPEVNVNLTASVRFDEQEL